MKKVVAIYHKDCNDGTTSAAIVLKKFPDAFLFPLAHNFTKEEFEPIEKLLDQEAEVYTVDCVIGVLEILKLGYKVTSLDHHIGIKEEYEKLARENPNFTFVFDNDKSGAGVTWSYLFPDAEMPRFVQMIQDGDLWTGKFGRDTRDLGNFASGARNNPSAYLSYMNDDIDKMIEKGKAVTDFLAEEIKDEYKKLPVILKIGDYEVPAYNIGSLFKSQSGHYFSEKLNKTVGVFTINGNMAKISFRSNDGQSPSALDLAKTLGGGGHNKAAAVFIPLKQFLDMIV